MTDAPAHGESRRQVLVDFKRRNEKIFILPYHLGTVLFSEGGPPTIGDEEIDNNRRIAMDAWHNKNFLCRNYILNGLDDTLYNVCSTFKTSKELWDSLDKKYKMEDAGTKKFVVGKFLEYKMVDTKSVISQVQEIQIILHDLVSEGIILNESFQLWIEEDNRKSEVKSSKSGMEAKANLAESSTSKKRKHSEKDKGKAKKFKGNCYNCSKPNHMAKDCRHPKKGNQGGNQQANVTEDKSVPIDMSELDLTTIVFEANMVDNPRE
ncbi:hypothetical protein DH2020_041624 [Rehmannia glutinosa]|uniref:CCHC-type domain-containing protein n=1 Tax=Rehmannia glutinosa TaxID=99300 RepID=A0ABR0UQT0_REHGL